MHFFGAGRADYFTPMTCLQTGIHPLLGLSLQKTVCPPGELLFEPIIAKRC